MQNEISKIRFLITRYVIKKEKEGKKWVYSVNDFFNIEYLIYVHILYVYSI